MDTDPKTAPVNNLSKVTVADTEAAKLVLQLLRSMADEETLNTRLWSVMEDIALKLYISAWTVYRWLIGQTRHPRMAQFRALQQLCGAIEAA